VPSISVLKQRWRVDDSDLRVGCGTLKHFLKNASINVELQLNLGREMERETKGVASERVRGGYQYGASYPYPRE
jgi:hypothetical protein